MRAGGFIPSEKVGRHIYVLLWDNEQRITNKITVATPALLSIAQRLIIHYSLTIQRSAGGMVAAENFLIGYNHVHGDIMTFHGQQFVQQLLLKA